MFKYLRIASCLLAVAAIAAAIFIFVYLGWVWGLVTVIAALVFIVLMFVFKNLQEDEEKSRPSATEGDFIAGEKNQEFGDKK